MEKLKIETISKTKDTVTRTIRINGSTFDKIAILDVVNHLCFNCVINKIIEFVLNFLEE